ncbi:MAG: SpoIID/LytB domain-containing protein [Cryomorphaceae bacterium]|nr:SpoIID/LytB domain-containing protein [Cryomorphaceae bacterium]
MRKALVFILLILLPGLAYAQLDIRVRLGDVPKNIAVSVKEGHYYIIAANFGGEIIDTVWDIRDDDPTRIFYISRRGSHIQLTMNKLGTLTFPELWLVPATTCSDPSFLISLNGGRDRWYQDKLHFFCQTEGGDFTVVNQVNLEKYVAGVVESEGGAFGELEYFKAQAVLARTFAVKNLKKHIHHRYNLRDDVTSQVYHSRAYLRNAALIDSATQLTADTVIADMEGELLLALFHANSGGQTANAGDVWSRDVPCLRSKTDPFSVNQNSYSWTKKINKSEMQKYFASQLGVAHTDVGMREKMKNFTQNERKPYFEYNGKKLKLTQVRNRFNLRSTYFSMEEHADYYMLKGKGYGHGVGLSQDGAINMSKMGFEYKDILYFYYENSQLINLTETLHRNEALRQMVIQNALWVDPGHSGVSVSP